MVLRSLSYAPVTHSKVLVANSYYERFEKALRSDSGYLRASTEPGQGRRQPTRAHPISRFVSGHGFSRAEKPPINTGLQPLRYLDFAGCSIYEMGPSVMAQR